MVKFYRVEANLDFDEVLNFRKQYDDHTRITTRKEGQTFDCNSV